MAAQNLTSPEPLENLASPGGNNRAGLGSIRALRRVMPPPFPVKAQEQCQISATELKPKRDYTKNPELHLTQFTMLSTLPS